MNSAPHAYLRNVAIADRNHLVIDPGVREITGANIHGGSRYAFDTGKFMKMPVYLGEIRTDEQGRLLVFGGFGKIGFVRRISGAYLRQQ